MTSRAVRRSVAACLSLVLLPALGACGSASETSPPSGVDELVIPTPSPDPADFVAGVDNRWFPLVPGTELTYQVRLTNISDDVATRTVTVEQQTVEVSGVATTAVDTVDPAASTTDYYAQDAAGNVWWFGREGQWRAGVDGGEAGVVMLASPRIGDGYRQGFLDGAVDVRASVVALRQASDVGAGSFTDVVEIEQQGLASTGATALSSFAPGVGLVLQEPDGGSGERVELVDVRSP